METTGGSLIMVDLPTREKLALALEAEDAPKWIIDKARQSYYDDYESPYPFPISALVSDLASVKMVKMISRAISGEFDATKEESDAWAKSEDGQATFAEFFKPKKE